MTTEARLTAIATPDRARSDGPLAAFREEGATSRDVEHVAVEDLEAQALRLLALPSATTRFRLRSASGSPPWSGGVPPRSPP